MLCWKSLDCVDFPLLLGILPCSVARMEGRRNDCQFYELLQNIRIPDINPLVLRK